VNSHFKRSLKKGLRGVSRSSEDNRLGELKHPEKLADFVIRLEGHDGALMNGHLAEFR